MHGGWLLKHQTSSVFFTEAGYDFPTDKYCTKSIDMAYYKDISASFGFLFNLWKAGPVISGHLGMPFLFQPPVDCEVPQSRSSDVNLLLLSWPTTLKAAL